MVYEIVKYACLRVKRDLLVRYFICKSHFMDAKAKLHCIRRVVELMKYSIRKTNHKNVS